MQAVVLSQQLHLCSELCTVRRTLLHSYSLRGLLIYPGKQIKRLPLLSNCTGIHPCLTLVLGPPPGARHDPSANTEPTRTLQKGTSLVTKRKTILTQTSSPPKRSRTRASSPCLPCPPSLCTTITARCSPDPHLAVSGAQLRAQQKTFPITCSPALFPMIFTSFPLCRQCFPFHALECECLKQENLVKLLRYRGNNDPITLLASYCCCSGCAYCFTARVELCT